MGEPNCRIVDFEAEDGLQLDGTLAYSGSDTTIVHVHGICGNFYTNEFIKVMNSRYPDHDVNFLSFNHRGHDCLAEAYTDGDLTYVGGSLEQFEETMLDIRAAVNFAASFSDRILLQGHSGGCQKVLYYDIETDDPLELILLSPSDSYELQSLFLAPETVEEQYQRLDEIDSPDDSRVWLDRNEYGMEVAGKRYHIPVTLRSLLDLHEGPALELLRYGEEWPYETLDTRLLACVGGDDSLCTVSVATLRRELEKRASTTELHHVVDGDHHFHGFEEELIEGIVEWIREP